MNRDAWEHFLEWAAYVRGNPRFEAEEHERKLELADRLRGLITEAEHGAPLDAVLDELFVSLSHPERPYDLTTEYQDGWLHRWAARAGEILRRSLAGFLDQDRPAEARFAQFVRAAEEAGAIGAIEHRPRIVITLGSLFNFATDPYSLPIVRPMPFARLERALGYEPKAKSPIEEQYRNHVQFANTVKTELVRAGLPAQHMLDVQGLILLSGRESSPIPSVHTVTPGATRARFGEGGRKDGKPYLSICACLGYDMPYLLEWIEFHRLVGVKRFFLYNNGDREAQRQLLRPYVEDGIVVLRDWPEFPPQVSAFRDCLSRHREDSRWIAFIDTDEFLFSPIGRSLADVLSAYEGWPGVGVNWIYFGPSGHRIEPAGFVIEKYVLSYNAHKWNYIKSIVDPHRARDCLNPHYFTYDHGAAVDENHYPVNGASTTFMSASKLRINHYFTRSAAEMTKKWERRRPDTGSSRRGVRIVEQVLHDESRFAQVDKTILRHLPALRDALKQRSIGVSK